MPILEGRHTCRCAHRGDGFHSVAAELHYPPDLGIEPRHTDIDLHVDVDRRSARGCVTTTVIGRRAGVRSLTFDAVDFQDVSVTDGSGSGLDFTYDGEKLEVTWPQTFAVGEERRVAVTYSVTNPVSGLFFGGPSEHDPDAARWAATDHETERARHWLPCIDHLNVRTTLAFHLRADAGFSILANGILTGEDAHDDGTRTAHWTLDFPCPSYLVCFALGEFTEARDGEFEGIQVAYFAAKHHPEDRLHRSFGRTRDMLSWMTKKLGAAFPFPKYFQFALPNFGGAMENISLVSWDDIFVLDADLAREWTWLVDQINVHEMAHSYFGDAVVCRDFAHVWLKESWATYMEQCWLEDQRGADEMQYDFYRNASAYFEEADGSYKRPMVTRKFDSSWDMYDRHLYPGGACRLHTLRHELGDDAFWKGVRTYVSNFTGRVVETEDFRRTLEESSGKPLARFFDQWFYAADYPHLAVSFSWDSDAKLGTYSFEQKQIAEDGKGQLFELGIEVAWEIGGEFQTRRVELRERKQDFVFAMAQDPTTVLVDPEGKVLHKLEFNPGDTKLARQLTQCPHVRGRILAAHELAKTGKPKNIQAIIDAWPSESFWGVKQQLASALAASKSQAAVDALASLMSAEDDPMVLSHLFGKAGALFDAGVGAAAIERARKGDLPPFAQAAAWRAIGRQRELADLDALSEAAAQSTYHEIARGGALAGLAASRSTSALEHLQRWATTGAAATPARSAAAGSIGALAEYLEARPREAARETLEGLLRDAEPRVFKAAARALVDMGATESVGHLHALSGRLPRQERVALGREIERLHKPKQAKLAAVEKQLEELRTEYRTLLDRVGKLEAKGNAEAEDAP